MHRERATISELYKEGSQFYMTIHFHPHIQSTHRLTPEQALKLNQGDKIGIRTWWENDVLQVETELGTVDEEDE